MVHSVYIDMPQTVTIIIIIRILLKRLVLELCEKEGLESSLELCFKTKFNYTILNMKNTSYH